MSWIGRWLVGVGVIHCAFGFVFMRNTLAVLWFEGILNTVNTQPDREATFWFLYAGFALILLGATIHRLEAAGSAIPRFVVWGFCVLTVLGAVVMPVSGIWLLIPPVVGMFVRGGRRTGVVDSE